MTTININEKRTPFRPPFLNKHLIEQRIQTIERKSSLDKGEENECQLVQLPNFLAALFSSKCIGGEDIEHVASKEQYQEIERIMETFYNITSETILDSHNEYQKLHDKGLEMVKANNKSSLNSVDACSDIINNILMSKLDISIQ